MTAVERKPSVHRVYPVSRIAGEGRAEVFILCEPGTGGGGRQLNLHAETLIPIYFLTGIFSYVHISRLFGNTSVFYIVLVYYENKSYDYQVDSTDRMLHGAYTYFVIAYQSHI